ncbi:hypothetical protein UFOVP707_47 [uncultured Caudovirales phage]|uniref:Uncharacterized protein n=1 Tax=uncultured Caudovirales phage TaxID=2100421 RepID=A0A6J5NIC5_9CAUD|nr:hypothetical protein UFOVP707_47 [uncultured Caudovirales phage]
MSWDPWDKSPRSIDPAILEWLKKNPGGGVAPDGFFYHVNLGGDFTNESGTQAVEGNGEIVRTMPGADGTISKRNDFERFSADGQYRDSYIGGAKSWLDKNGWVVPLAVIGGAYLMQPGGLLSGATAAPGAAAGGAPTAAAGATAGTAGTSAIPGSGIKFAQTGSSWLTGATTGGGVTSATGTGFSLGNLFSGFTLKDGIGLLGGALQYVDGRRREDDAIERSNQQRAEDRAERDAIRQENRENRQEDRQWQVEDRNEQRAYNEGRENAAFQRRKPVGNGLLGLALKRKGP